MYSTVDWIQGFCFISLLCFTLLPILPTPPGAQVSNWGQRPLSAQQLSYAALDAFCAVLIFRGMGQEHHPFCTRQGLSHHVFTYDRRRGGVNGGGQHTPARRPPSGGGNGSGGQGHGNTNGGAQGHGHTQGHAHGHNGSSGNTGGGRAGHNGGPHAAAAFSCSAAPGMRVGWTPAGGLRGSCSGFGSSRGVLLAAAQLRPTSSLGRGGHSSKAAAHRQLTTPRMLQYFVRLSRHVTCLL